MIGILVRRTAPTHRPRLLTPLGRDWLAGIALAIFIAACIWGLPLLFGAHQ
jgi:hypothetical protein